MGVLLLGLMVEKFPSLIFLGAFTEVDLEMSRLKVLGEVGFFTNLSFGKWEGCCFSQKRVGFLMSCSFLFLFLF